MTGRHRLASAGSYCSYHLVSHRFLVLSFSVDQSIPLPAVSSVSISWTRSNDLWCSIVYWILTLILSSSISGALTCPSPSIKSAFAPVKNRKKRTSFADCGGRAAFRTTTLSRSGDMLSLENTFPKNFTTRR